MKKLIIVLSVMAFAFLAANQTFAQSHYKVEGKLDGKWHTFSNEWIIGSRKNQHPIELKFASGNRGDKNDGGKTSMGQVKYDQKEGMLGLKLVTKGNEDGQYSAYTKKGNADWISDGAWLIRSNKTYTLVNLNAKSSDGGKTLVGMGDWFIQGRLVSVEIKATLK